MGYILNGIIEKSIDSDLSPSINYFKDESHCRNANDSSVLATDPPVSHSRVIYYYYTHRHNEKASISMGLDLHLCNSFSALQHLSHVLLFLQNVIKSI